MSQKNSDKLLTRKVILQFQGKKGNGPRVPPADGVPEDGGAKTSTIEGKYENIGAMGRGRVKNLGLGGKTGEVWIGNQPKKNHR